MPVNIKIYYIYTRSVIFEWTLYYLAHPAPLGDMSSQQQRNPYQARFTSACPVLRARET